MVRVACLRVVHQQARTVISFLIGDLCGLDGCLPGSQIAQISAADALLGSLAHRAALPWARCKGHALAFPKEHSAQGVIV